MDRRLHMCSCRRRVRDAIIGYLVSFATVSHLSATTAFQAVAPIGRPILTTKLPTQLDSSSTSSSPQDSSSTNDEKKKPKTRRFAQTVHQRKITPVNTNTQFNPDRMWKNGKSIEQLEERLSTRWGTDIKPWTSQDVDDDDEEDAADPSTQIAGEVEQSFRARPVKDPWQVDNNVQKARPTLLGGDSKEDTAVRRARKNQERLRLLKQTDDQPEFYDNDDLGYENKRNDNTGDGLQVEHLIAPKPVGGKGSSGKRDSADRQETFFFSPPKQSTATNVEDEKEEENDATPKRRQEREKIPAIPILDEDGNPTFLTLKQANRNFKTFLDANGSDDSSTVDTTERLAVDWSDLGILHPTLIKNLQKMGCERPLAVQEKTCPAIVEGKDVLVGTYTGSGKTLAFLVPLVQSLLTKGDLDGNLKLIIVAPGRELASQIVSVARDLLQATNISVMMAIGGTTFGRNLEQIRKRKPNILVGTPGRIAELVVGPPGERVGRVKISNLESLVLDEFDALLEYKPHSDPTRAIMQLMKQQRGARLQSILCSATATDLLGSQKLQSFLREGYVLAMADSDDKLVTSGGDGQSNDGKGTRVSRTVIHGVIHVPHRRFALSALRSILHTEPLPQQILIFVENSRKVQIVVEKLDAMGIIAAPLHGGMGSEKMDRAEVSKALREGYVGIVVATELAARGLDAPLLTHVINLDLPTDASHYAHRAGRCGRGGRAGVVINITTSPQERNVPQKFADQLGIQMNAVEPRNGRLNIVDPASLILD